ncbi:unnamed protein product [Linum trigynum]|uniref:RNase H type-1 domain-containing protein n=1 Tax=Linum trigynum TaxID=586398 RepID=A0AAV2E4C3_9ROSI
MMKAFAMNLGEISITRVELEGIVHGMCLAWAQGYMKIMVHTESQIVIHLLREKIIDLVTAKPLGEYVTKLITRRHLGRENSVSCNMIPNKVSVKFNVLRPLMKHGISGNV